MGESEHGGVLVIVVGASGGMGGALIEILSACNGFTSVIAVLRHVVDPPDGMVAGAAIGIQSRAELRP